MRQARRSCTLPTVAWATGPSGSRSPTTTKTPAGEHVRGSDAGAGWRATVKNAVDAYERDLTAHRGDAATAERIRKHPRPMLASKPVTLLTAAELEPGALA